MPSVAIQSSTLELIDRLARNGRDSLTQAVKFSINKHLTNRLLIAIRSIEIRAFARHQFVIYQAHFKKWFSRFCLSNRFEWNFLLCLVEVLLVIAIYTMALNKNGFCILLLILVCRQLFVFEKKNLGKSIFSTK